MEPILLRCQPSSPFQLIQTQSNGVHTILSPLDDRQPSSPRFLGTISALPSLCHHDSWPFITTGSIGHPRTGRISTFSLIWEMGAKASGHRNGLGSSEVERPGYYEDYSSHGSLPGFCCKKALLAIYLPHCIPDKNHQKQAASNSKRRLPLSQEIQRDAYHQNDKP